MLVDATTDPHPVPWLLGALMIDASIVIGVTLGRGCIADIIVDESVTFVVSPTPAIAPPTPGGARRVGLVDAHGGVVTVAGNRDRRG